MKRFIHAMPPSGGGSITHWGLEMSIADDLPLMVSLMIFVSIMLLFLASYYFKRYRRSRARFFEKIRQDGSASEARSYERSTQASAGTVGGPIARFLDAVGKRMQPGETEDLKRRNLQLVRAGIRRSNALAVFWGCKCILALCLAGLFLALKPILFPQLLASKVTVSSLLLVATGFYMPDVWLKMRISDRRRRIQDGLPDALDLLVVCVEAGMSLDSAIHRVGEEIRLENPELSDELLLMTLEIRAGKLRRDAMRSLAIRTDLEDIGSLVTLLVQTDQLGTSIAQALRVYSDAFRTKRMQRAEEIASRLPVKLVLPLGLFILPAMLAVIIGPPAIQAFRAFIQK